MEFFVLHRSADARAHIPSRLIRASSDHPVNLIGADALLRMEYEEDNANPFAKRIVGILEYGTGDDAEAVAVLLMAGHNLASLRHSGLLATFAEIMERARLEPV